MPELPNQPADAHDDQQALRGGREVPQHLSGDSAKLDALDAASADSFPASDLPAMSVPSAAAPTETPDTEAHADAGTITDPDQEDAAVQQVHQAPCVQLIPRPSHGPSYAHPCRVLASPARARVPGACLVNRVAAC